MKVGPDGALYVSELTGYPFPSGQANIYRIDPCDGKTVGFCQRLHNHLRLHVRAERQPLCAGPEHHRPCGASFLRRAISGRSADGDSGRPCSAAACLPPDSLTVGSDGTLFISELGTSPSGGEILSFGTAGRARSLHHGLLRPAAGSRLGLRCCRQEKSRSGCLSIRRIR